MPKKQDLTVQIGAIFSAVTKILGLVTEIPVG
jgi:hypothetical protein